MARPHSRSRLKLDLSDERLWDGDRVIGLSPKSFYLLRYFVLHPNQLLIKRKILAHVWPTTRVTEGSVKDLVQTLRRALGDDPKRPRFIETVRGRGYRYVGEIEVTPVGNDQISTEKGNWDTPSLAALSLESLERNSSRVRRTGPPRVVVLPWQHIGDADQLRLFGHGFSAELTNLLTKNRDLAVIAKSSAASLDGQSEPIGRARHRLRADYVIEGEVFGHDDGLRFALTAVNTETEAIIWSDSFTVNGSQLSAFEMDLAPRVATALGANSGALIRDATATAKRRLPTDLTAFERYLLALEIYTPHTRVGLKQALQHVNAALTKDPEHAQSWLLLAYMLQESVEDASGDEFGQFKAQRLEAIGKAVSLDPLDGRILIEHAGCRYDWGDHEGSAQTYSEVYSMNRGVADVLTLLAKYLAGVNSNADAALHALQVARSLNPVGDVMLASNELRTFYILGDLNSAIKAGEACPDTPLRSLFLALSHLESGERDIARDVILEARRRRPEFEPARFLSEQHYIRATPLRARFRSGVRVLSSYLGQSVPDGV